MQKEVGLDIPRPTYLLLQLVLRKMGGIVEIKSKPVLSVLGCFAGNRFSALRFV